MADNGSNKDNEYAINELNSDEDELRWSSLSESNTQLLFEIINSHLPLDREI